MTEALVIANPAAGAVRPGLIDAVAERCRRWLRDVQVYRTRGPRDTDAVVADAVRRGAGRLRAVLAVGGDGTVREVADSLVRALGGPDGRGVPASAGLLVVPAGTGNSVHRALWNDRPWEEVVDAVLGGDGARLRRLDLLRAGCDDTVILLGASTGFIAAVTDRASREFAGVAGRERYHLAIGAVVGDFEPYPGRVEVDGRTLHEGPTLLATVGGARHRVGTFEILPRSILDDGLLDVCVVDGSLSAEDRMVVAGLAIAGQHVDHPAVHYAQGTRVTLERTDGRPLDAEHDGDVRAGTGSRLHLEVLPGALPVHAPLEAVAG